MIRPLPRERSRAPCTPWRDVLPRPATEVNSSTHTTTMQQFDGGHYRPDAALCQRRRTACRRLAMRPLPHERYRAPCAPRRDVLPRPARIVSYFTPTRVGGAIGNPATRE
jgi:hypothetical protein